MGRRPFEDTGSIKMDNKTQDDKQKQMPWFAFKVMTLIMSVR
jgi:hypothetical protein